MEDERSEKNAFFIFSFFKKIVPPLPFPHPPLPTASLPRPSHPATSPPPNATLVARPKHYQRGLNLRDPLHRRDFIIFYPPRVPRLILTGLGRGVVALEAVALLLRRRLRLFHLDTFATLSSLTRRRDVAREIRGAASIRRRSLRRGDAGRSLVRRVRLRLVDALPTLIALPGATAAPAVDHVLLKLRRAEETEEEEGREGVKKRKEEEKRGQNPPKKKRLSTTQSLEKKEKKKLVFVLLVARVEAALSCLSSRGDDKTRKRFGCQRSRSARDGEFLWESGSGDSPTLAARRSCIGPTGDRWLGGH